MRKHKCPFPEEICICVEEDAPKEVWLEVVALVFLGLVILMILHAA